MVGPLSDSVVAQQHIPHDTESCALARNTLLMVVLSPVQILTAARLRRLAEAVPLGQAMKTWRLGYSIARDGASLWTLLQNCRGRGP